jgi:hypothetical protein
MKKTSKKTKWKTTGFYFKDGRGKWHHVDTKPRGKQIEFPIEGRSNGRKLMIKEVLPAKEYIANVARA